MVEEHDMFDDDTPLSKLLNNSNENKEDIKLIESEGVENEESVEGTFSVYTLQLYLFSLLGIQNFSFVVLFSNLYVVLIV